MSRWEEFAWTNAFVHVDPDAVRHDAHGASGGPLDGDLFSVKDLFAVAGVPSRAGSLVLGDYRPAIDAGVVGRVRRSGALFFGKTNCAEFGFGIDTDTRLGGRVHHPERADLSPGGSSGGDAVAVATGIVDFAIAGDYGGSIRWPAQSLSIYGLRPGLGVIPRDGRIGGLGAHRDNPLGLCRAPWQLAGELEVAGLMARTPAKIAEVLRATSNRTTINPRRGRVLVTLGTEIAPVTDEVREAVETVANRARTHGLTVDDADGLFRDAWSTYSLLREKLDDHNDIRALVRGREDLLCDATRMVLNAAPRDCLIDSEVRDAWVTATEIRRRLRQRLTEYDALIMPCAPVGAIGFAEQVQVGGTVMSGHQLMAHLRAVSLSALPALAMPVGSGTGGRPVSVQLVGGPGSETDLCALAEILAVEQESALSNAGLHGAGRVS
nr:amidase [Gordonia sp. SID5947]